jgi:hypothetical protein
LFLSITDNLEWDHAFYGLESRENEPPGSAVMAKRKGNRATQTCIITSNMSLANHNLQHFLAKLIHNRDLS